MEKSKDKNNKNKNNESKNKSSDATSKADLKQNGTAKDNQSGKNPDNFR